MILPILLLLTATDIFDGKTLDNWVNVGGANFRVEHGEIIVDKGAYSWLRTRDTYKDYELHIEFKTAANGNSGVFLRSSAVGKPHETGYELQIYDERKDFRTGSIVDVAEANPVTKINPNVWNSFDVKHIGSNIVVKLNGKKIVDTKDSKSKSGHIGLQFNPDKPVSFRKIKIKEL